MVGFYYLKWRCLFNSLRHSAGPLAFGLQAQSRGCVKLVGVKVVCPKGGVSKSWFVVCAKAPAARALRPIYTFIISYYGFCRVSLGFI